MNIDINRAVQIIKQGGIIIYPTETFFALGGSGRDPEVVRKIREIKARPYQKPLPLIAGSLAQCLEDVEMDSLSLKIARQFWPGPLSLLVRAREMIPYGVKDQEGMVSIRVTPHQEAAKLCLLSGTPLVATSANFSGKPACAGYYDLDKKLVSIVGQVLDSQETPAGGLPSTLVRVVGNRKLRIIREGKVSPADIVQKGWEIQL
jgi:L-threonylcarbamoyladenylate synthase